MQWEADYDGDGWSSSWVVPEACENPGWYYTIPTSQEDCDDLDASIYPGAPEVCDGVDQDCNRLADDGAAIGADSDCAADSCIDVLASDSAATDGTYFIDVGGAVYELYCDMSEDLGGWTMVANFVWPGDAGGVSGWSSGGAVGSDFSDDSLSFKLPDADINDLVTEAFRVDGQASTCLGGPCSADITLFFSSACSYDSTTTSSGACAEGYRDITLSTAAGYSSPCTDDHGLTRVDCGVVNELVSNVAGDQIIVGPEDDAEHAYSGRAGEDPELRIWVR